MPESQSSPDRSGSAAASSIGSKLRTLFSRYSRADLIFFSVLSMLLLCGVYYLSEAENPWGKAVQRRLDKGQALQLSEFVIIGLWWGTLAATIGMGLLLATFRWWRPSGQGLPTPQKAAIPAVPKSNNALFIFLTVLAVGVGIWESYPRLSQSLWNDEEYAMRRYAHGAYEMQADGSWKFEPVSWRDTLFLNRQGNNHLINSLTMHFALSTWRVFTGASIEQFDETVLRTPAFLLSIGTIVFTALLGRIIGHPIIGAVAALLLAMNPWFVHYMSDAKGYSSLMCFMSLHFIGLVKALETDKLRWWLLFAIAQMCYVLSFSGSIYIAVCTSLLVCIEMIRQGKPGKILTLAGFNLLSALPVIIWVAPSIPQYMYYLNKEDALRLPMDWTWIRDLLCALYVGNSFENPMPEKHLGTSWTEIQASTPWFLNTLFSKILVPLFLITGVIMAFVRGRSARIILFSPLLAAVLSFYHNSGSDHPMVIWYLIFLVVPLSLLAALGVTTLGSRNKALLAVLCLGLVGGYASITWGANQLHRQHERQPIRQMAAWIKGQNETALTATWGVSQNQSRSYLPQTRFPESVPELEKLEALSVSEKRPFYVYICGNDATSKRNPDLMGHVRNSGRYEQVQEVQGLEELFTYLIFKYEPVSAPQTVAPESALPQTAAPSPSPQAETPREVVPVTPEPAVIIPAPEATPSPVAP